MIGSVAQRVRRPAQESRRLILEAAERLLIEGGPLAVQVRAVAEQVGITDAGVAHHFGSRDDLLVALLRHGGRRLRQTVDETVRTWIDDGADVASLVKLIAALYRDGYGALAVALHSAGWRDPGGGLLDPVVEALHAARQRSGARRPRLEETRLAVAALHQALATDPLYGPAFRRSAGIPKTQADRQDGQLAWWTATLTSTLDLDATGRRSSSKRSR